VTSAKRLAHVRLLVAGLAAALPLLFPLAVSTLSPQTPAVAVAVGIASLVVGAVAFFFFALRWRPRCPGCERARATFVRSRDEDEHLVCASCGFREATGYTFRG
jgi:hypothetical protein